MIIKLNGKDVTINHDTMIVCENQCKKEWSENNVYPFIQWIMKLWMKQMYTIFYDHTLK